VIALAVRRLRKAYGGVVAVDEVSFDLEAGTLLAMIGPNGAGKSTCFNMLNGQIRPDSGSVQLFGRELVGQPPRRIARLGIGRTFQITATFGSMTVQENLQMALIARHRRDWALWHPAGAMYAAEARELLRLVGMHEQAERPCSVLSYGDLKRVELAVALAGGPRLLLLDEPTAGMAPRERIELMELAAGIARSGGLSVLFTEHDMDIVFHHADSIMVLDRGRLIARGTPAEIRETPEVRAVYLGGQPVPDRAPRTA
jgi:branched-chain amino acid transport system ATP-binding protein